MRVIYLASAIVGGNIINFQVTGEGVIPEECEQDGKQKALLINPLCRQITLQPVATIV